MTSPSPEAFARFAADLALPDIHEMLQDAEPLDEPVPTATPRQSGTATTGSPAFPMAWRSLAMQYARSTRSTDKG